MTPLDDNLGLGWGRVLAFALAVLGVSLPEKERLQLLPDRRVVPMLAEDVSWVVGTWHVVETYDASGDGFPSLVVGEGVVSLHNLGVRHGCGVDDRLVVSKHHGRSLNTDSQIPEGVA